MKDWWRCHSLSALTNWHPRQKASKTSENSNSPRPCSYTATNDADPLNLAPIVSFNESWEIDLGCSLQLTRDSSWCGTCKNMQDSIHWGEYSKRKTSLFIHHPEKPWCLHIMSWTCRSELHICSPTGREQINMNASLGVWNVFTLSSLCYTVHDNELPASKSALSLGSLFR